MPLARTAYHHGSLREALLECAEQMLERTGPGEVSLREVARQAGVSHGAPRRHFPDKQALLDALAENGFERLGRDLDTAVQGVDGSFTVQLTAFARAWVNFASRHPALLDMMFASKNRPQADSLRQAADRAFAASSAMIREAQARHDIVDGDNDQAATAILATVQGLTALIVSGMLRDRPPDVLIADTIATLVDGLRPRS
jgi:AcrR family transcriptional regulator